MITTMNGTVAGIVRNVTDAKIFTARKGNSSIGKDYYHVVIEVSKLPPATGKKLTDIARELESINDAWKRSGMKTHKLARVYFPVVANVSNRERSSYDKKTFTTIIDKSGNEIPYQIANPKLLVGKKVEVTGAMKTEETGDYYINQIQSFKIFE